MTVILSFTCYSQKNDTFDPEHTQFNKLGQIINNKINEARDSIGLSFLIQNVDIQKAAQLQADFLSKKGHLNHLQGKKKFKTPFDRVLYFDSSYKLAGENIAYVSAAMVTIVGTKKETEFKTYEELAQELVGNWIRSNAHWKNISDARYTDTGIALVYNEKENRIYAVQVFGAK